MTGDNRVRFCGECNLNVYNFAELTLTQAEQLLRTSEGRVCGRLYRRTDGTLITKDCPVGLRAVRRRVAKIATAAFATVISLGSAAFGQKQSDNDKACKQQVAITTKLERDSSSRAKLTGTLLDPMGAVIAGAEIKLINQQTKETESLRSNDEGQFSKGALAPGVYEVFVKQPGFKDLKFKLKIGAGETVVINATLLVNGETTMGIIAGDPFPPSGTTIITGDRMRKLPIP